MSEKSSLPLVFALLVLYVWTPPALAQSASPPETSDRPAHTFELGLNLRTDFGVHAARIDLGYKTESFGALLVLDPMFWTNGQTSTDLLFFWLRDGFQPFAGWRLNTVPLTEGAQLQQNLVLGVGLPFPKFFGGRVTGQWGVELATMVVKHGGGLPSETIAFKSGRHYIDLVNFGMFARFDYNLELFR